jgi:hypothetical protein
LYSTLANINDRSLLGGRDAEVGGVVEDTNLVPSYMGDKKVIGYLENDMEARRFTYR